MFSLSDLKQTRFYQEAKDEGIQQGRQEGIQEGIQQAKLDTIPKLLELGLSLEIIALTLDLPPETVVAEARKYSSGSEN